MLIIKAAFFSEGKEETGKGFKKELEEKKAYILHIG